MKRADVRAGVIYATKLGALIAVLDDALWRDQQGGYESSRIASADRYVPVLRGDSTRASDGFPAMRTWRHGKPSQWTWEPTIACPRDLLAPLDEYERQQEEEIAQCQAARERRERVIAERRVRVAAITDVLRLDDDQVSWLCRLSVGEDQLGTAAVTLEWLEEIAGRLRGGA